MRLCLLATGSYHYAWIHTWRQRWGTNQITVVGSFAAEVRHFVVLMLEAINEGRARKSFYNLRISDR